MKNINLIQNISDANASGRGLASAPQNIGCNTSLNSKKVQQNGRSMIEMLGVLAIIGVLSVGGIAGYSKAMMKYRINKTIEQITLIAGNVRTFFSSQNNYADLSINVIKKAKLVPDEMWNEDKTSVVNVFGGAFYVHPIPVTGQNKKYFGISIYKIPQEACIELATYDWSVVSAYAIEVAPTSITDISHYGGGIKGCRSGNDSMGGYLECNSSNMTLEQAVQYCKNAEVNSITLAIQ